MGLAILALVACGGGAGPRPAPAPASLTVQRGTLRPSDATPRALAAAAGSFASSVDTDGVPTFLWAARGERAPASATAAEAARFHLARHAASLGLSGAALAACEVTYVDERGAAGTIAHVRQRRDGIEIYGREARLLMTAGRDLIAQSGRLDPFVESAGSRAIGRSRAPRGSGEFRLSEERALAVALEHLFATPIAPAAIVALDTDGDFRRLALAAGAPLRLPEPARVKKVYFPAGDGLRPAFFVEMYAGLPDSSVARAFRYLVAADDGQVLERRDLESHDSFSYRVWADPTDGRPLDGPVEDFTPYPRPMPDGSVPGYVPPQLIAMEAFNHNAQGRPDPWLAADAVQTAGNNVDAYLDRFAPDGFSTGDFRARVSAPRAFDRIYDPTLQPYPEAQAMAGLTQVFYDLNWLHDWFYDSGFDEAAGNAQRSNFGRGGLQGDPLRAEAQDFSGRNNSDMAIPSDGMSPRMQVYTWTAPETRKLTVTPVGDIGTGAAAFGATYFEVTAAVALVDDRTGTRTDGCEAIASDVAGKIALLDRSGCTYKQQVLNAEAAGAVGVIIADDRAAMRPPYLSDSDPGVAVRTAPMSVTQARGAAIRTALEAGIVTATMSSRGEVERDGTLDSCVVAHEWGHYLHHRLAACSAGQCAAASEGWGDFNALLMVLRDGDNLDGTFGIAPYAARSTKDSAYFGLRRQPYSVDQSRDGLTFRHIADGEPLPDEPMQQIGGGNSEVHNAGEVWATMLFEAYVALLRSGRAQVPPLSFDEVRRRMSDYVVAGLKLTPDDATFTEARDAILAAALARSRDDMTTLAQAFARRGAGSCAQSPPRDSQSFAGVVEDFSVAPRLAIGEVTLDDSVRSCDGDGVLDAGERGVLTIEVENGGLVPLASAVLTLGSPSPGVTFPAGSAVRAESLPPLSTTRLTAEVALDDSWRSSGTIEVRIGADSASACEGSSSRSVVFRVNHDEKARASASDDVEAVASQWTADGTLIEPVFSRVLAGPGNHAWRALDAGSQSDGWLVSPSLVVSATAPLSIEFDHRYAFETASFGGGTFYLDAGVIEISDDGGGSWLDVSTWVDPGYNGTVDSRSGSSLGGRTAFVDSNPRFPDADHVSLALGQQLAGKTILVRFFIGTDQAVGGFGWELDNFVFRGLENLPFTALVDDVALCGARPADLGPDGAGGGAGLAGGGCSCSLGPRRGGRSDGALAMLLALGALTFLWRRTLKMLEQPRSERD